MKNILSFDVEEYFQVSGLQKGVSRSAWENYKSRVEKSTDLILWLLNRHQVKATFFVLGWIAERHGRLVQKIAQEGHEIACHGYDHKLVYDMSVEEFAVDVKRTRDILESICGWKVRGYRAPSFSLAADDKKRFAVLSELGFTYDSSLFPMKHFRYGNALSIPLAPFVIKNGEDVLLREFPMTVVDFWGRKIPAGGGGYFRLYPNWLLHRNFKQAERQQRPVIVYLHPWEFDPGQPRIHGAGLGNTFRHYLNLGKTRGKLDKLLQEYEFCSFREYIKAEEQAG